eukprot:gene8257-8445_t
MKPKHKLQVSSTLAKGTIARVFKNAGKTKGVPDTRWALVLEYAKDGSLHQQVHKQMRTAVRLYSNTQALHWALDIAYALEYLHSHSPAIIHRDVKLSNMLCVRTEDGQVVAKLSDFGLLRYVQYDHWRHLGERRRDKQWFKLRWQLDRRKHVDYG